MEVIAILLEHFPLAMKAKDGTGREPLELVATDLPEVA
eukprot:CAMPEP_0116578732 /NCGR_PEP_ID=MMETSP0397-20121206/21870_1 /TAXON_ID=216820 /ORGANISM="Cyclophora tenuis, Strain ECT3854" /LENGTH=37 /DNA_ID= /DNA_START= /DNA_END= /DNA_ORIENTATION=